MRSQSFQIKNVLILLASLLAILLIYSIDLYELSYKLKGWEKMGASPVAARQIQYLLADTPALVGFKDPESGEQVTCGTSIAYVKTAAGDPYRCCDTGEKIACLAGDFSTESRCLTRHAQARSKKSSQFQIHLRIQWITRFLGIVPVRGRGPSGRWA